MVVLKGTLNTWTDDKGSSGVVLNFPKKKFDLYLTKDNTVVLEYWSTGDLEKLLWRLTVDYLGWIRTGRIVGSFKVLNPNGENPFCPSKRTDLSFSYSSNKTFFLPDVPVFPVLKFFREKKVQLLLAGRDTVRELFTVRFFDHLFPQIVGLQKEVSLQVKDSPLRIELSLPKENSTEN